MGMNRRPPGNAAIHVPVISAKHEVDRSRVSTGRIASMAYACADVTVCVARVLCVAGRAKERGTFESLPHRMRTGEPLAAPPAAGSGPAGAPPQSIVPSVAVTSAPRGGRMGGPALQAFWAPVHRPTTCVPKNGEAHLSQCIGRSRCRGSSPFNGKRGHDADSRGGLWPCGLIPSAAFPLPGHGMLDRFGQKLFLLVSQ